MSPTTRSQDHRRESRDPSEDFNTSNRVLKDLKTPPNTAPGDETQQKVDCESEMTKKFFALGRNQQFLEEDLKEGIPTSIEDEMDQQSAKAKKIAKRINRRVKFVKGDLIEALYAGTYRLSNIASLPEFIGREQKSPTTIALNVTENVVGPAVAAPVKIKNARADSGKDEYRDAKEYADIMPSSTSCENLMAAHPSIFIAISEHEEKIATLQHELDSKSKELEKWKRKAAFRGKKVLEIKGDYEGSLQFWKKKAQELEREHADFKPLDEKEVIEIASDSDA